MVFIAYIKKKFKGLMFRLNRFFNLVNFVPYKGTKKIDLLIFDDIYPHPVSGFRHEEFTTLLNTFPESKIIMTGLAYSVVQTPLEQHKKDVSELQQVYKPLQKKLKLKKGFVNINTNLFYCVFLNNIFNNLGWLEKYRIPFVFTLYPGGGFHTDDALADKKLKKIFDSPMFLKVIVTQEFTRDYLINRNLCRPEYIVFIFGCVVPQISLNQKEAKKKYYLVNKPTFDICFCAAKYSIKGEDKGYDVFIDFAHKISSQYDFVRFHVIGGFSESDIDVTLIKDKIVFYGYQDFEDLSGIFKNMDVMISPNKPFVLSKGAFDGFPLGTVIEAALNGVVILITDALNQNKIFNPDEELIIIKSESISIVSEVSYLINHPDKLYLISKQGRAKFINTYSNEMQMKPRIKLLENEIEKLKYD